MLKIGFRKLILLLGDIALLYVSLGLTLLFHYNFGLFPAEALVGNAWQIHKIPFLYVHALWIAIFYSAGLYDWERFSRNHINLAKLVLKTMLFGGVAAMALFYFVPAFAITPKTNLIIHTALSAVLLLVWRIALAEITAMGDKNGVLILGTKPESQMFIVYLNTHPSLGYRAVTVTNILELTYEKLRSIIAENKIEIVVVEPSALNNKDLVEMLYQVLPLGISFVSFDRFYEDIMQKIPTSLINKTWFLENLVELNKRTFEIVKRVSDILICLILLLAAILLFPFVALAIILSRPSDIAHYKQRRARDGDGIIFFRQRRVGENGAIFNFIKFRSQVLGAEKMGNLKTTLGAKDPRHYWIGKIFRKTYLDEFPQIINVLKGEMSIVGPRPERPEYVDQLKQKIPFYDIRHLVRPGITGWAQINMENDASVEDAPEKLQYDLYYIKNRSLVLDLAIILKTAAILVSRSGR